MPRIDWKTCFHKSFDEDLKAITGRDFTDRLASCAETAWISRIDKLAAQDHKGDLILKLREYLGCPPDIRLETDALAICEHTVSLKQIRGAANGKIMLSGELAIEQKGTYRLPLRQVTVEISTSANLSIQGKQIVNDRLYRIRYALQVDPSLIYRREQEAYLSVRIGHCRLRQMLRLVPALTGTGALMEQINTFEELIGVPELKTDLLKRFADLDARINPYHDWFKRWKFALWPVSSAAWVRPDEQDLALKALLGLLPAQKPQQRISRALILTDPANWILVRIHRGSLLRFMNEADGFIPIQADQRVLTCHAAKNDIIAKPPDLKERRPEIVKARLINRFPGRSQETFRVCNRGLRPFRLGRRIWLVQNGWLWRLGALTDVWVNQPDECRQIRYHLAGSGRRFQPDKPVYNWRSDLLSLMQYLWLILLLGQQSDRKQARQWRRQSMRLARRILASQPFRSTASRMTVMLCLVIRSLRTSTASPHLLHGPWPLIGRLGLGDWLFYRRQQRRFAGKDWRVTLLNGPIILMFNPIAPTADPEGNLTEDWAYSLAVLRRLDRAIRIAGRFSDALAGQAANRLIGLIRSASPDQAQLNLLVETVLKSTSSRSGSLRYLLWRCFPSEQLARTYLRLLDAQDFQPAVFTYLKEIIAAAPDCLGTDSLLIRRMIDWQLGQSTIDRDFFAVLHRTAWAEMPVVQLLGTHLSDEAFMERFCACDPIHPVLADQCEKRLAAVPDLRDPWALLALLKLRHLKYVSCTYLEQLDHSFRPLRLRICQHGRQASPVYLLWPGGVVMTAVPCEVAAVYALDLHGVLPARFLTIHTRNILDPSVIRHVQRLGQRPDQISVLLGRLPSPSETAYPDMMTDLVYLALDLFCQNTQGGRLTGSLKQAMNGQWSALANRLLDLMRVYRPSCHLRLFEGILAHLDAILDLEIEQKLRDLAVRIDPVALPSGGRIDAASVTAVRAIRLQEQYDQGIIDEPQIRKIVTEELLPQKNCQADIAWLCRQLFQETGLFAPYGAYLVTHWSGLPSVIADDDSLARQLVVLTDDHEFRIHFHLQRSDFGPHCRSALSRAFRSTQQISPVMARCLDRLIYQAEHKDTAGILDLILAYWRSGQAKMPHLHELVCQYRMRQKALPIDCQEAVRQAGYRRFLQTFFPESGYAETSPTADSSQPDGAN